MIARGRRSLVALVVWVSCVALGSSAGATDSNELRLLLLGMQDMSTPQTLLRADMEVSVESGGTTRKTQAVALFAPGKDARWYLQVREPAIEALVLGSERKVMQHTGATTETVSLGTQIDALGIAYEDLSRFMVDDHKLWQITDEGLETILVGMHPGVESAYVYRAYLIDKDKKVPVRTQFYVKTLNNLAKLRVDRDHALVGTKWMPSAIDVEDYTDAVNTKITIKWTPNATAPPELLAPTSFAAAPLLQWTTAPASPATSPPTAKSPARQ